MNTFTTKSLPEAVATLFELNNYTVRSDFQISGAQIDLMAKSKTDDFAPEIYIEATIEYVNNDKYSKDLTKFAMLREKFPNCVCLIVSSSGFSNPVVERATATRIETATYDELFRRFEKFVPYADHILSSKHLENFNATYEEPLFSDSKGSESATAWLTRWRDDKDAEGKWLIVLGEYGTGKTSLTQVLQYRWLEQYRNNPALPIPFRIELRSFSRQFDADTLLHHFLDTNNLSHISIQFVYHLMRTGRVILLLDGYDEMAQYLNSRERRACLGALARLAKDGARGVLTSRPNYFSETEELRVFEALYATLELNSYHISRSDREYLENEKAIDTLVTQYVLERYERYLRDLDSEQTSSLVRRKLADDPDGQKLILNLLDRVFREEMGGSKIALSGKPVIIAYLLELIDELKSSANSDGSQEITEWDIYKMIVDRLMMRDQQRSPLDPQRRRRCLQDIALRLSNRDTPVAREALFDEVVDKEFRTQLRLMQADEKRHFRDEMFQDLRGSATLTRSEGDVGTGWAFSHNSLREYLCVENLLDGLLKKNPGSPKIPISAAMRAFAASLPDQLFDQAIAALQELWPQRHAQPGIGIHLSLLWSRLGPDPRAAYTVLQGALAAAKGALPMDSVRLTGISLEDIRIDDDPLLINANDSELTDISADGIDLTASTFANTTFDNVSFSGSNLTNVNFSGSFLFDCDFSRAVVANAVFRRIDTSSSIIVRDRDGIRTQLLGRSALGYLSFNGAETDEIPVYYKLEHHPRFPILIKISTRLLDQRNSQMLGLTQRGEAHIDPPFARAFIQLLESSSFITIDRKKRVSLTDTGREQLSSMIHNQIIPDRVVEFLNQF